MAVSIASLTGAGVRKIQSGAIAAIRTGAASGATQSYRDVTLGTAVIDTAKCVVSFDGYFYESNLGTVTAAASGNDSFSQCSAALTSTTNLRIGSWVNNSSHSFVGQWYVIEYY